MSKLSKEFYQIIQDENAESVSAGAYTMVKNHEDGVLIVTSEDLKYNFLKELYSDMDDMHILSLESNGDIMGVKTFEFVTTKGTPIELNDSYDYNISVRRVFDTLNSCHLSELDNVHMEFKNNGEKIVWDSTMKSISAFLKSCKGKEDLDLQLDLSSLQYILSPSGQLICIDPFYYL